VEREEEGGKKKEKEDRRKVRETSGWTYEQIGAWRKKKGEKE